jgi:predicted GIY-YIG superfamily endonuclease
MNNFIVYLLINTKNKYTYLGVTNNSDKRIRQHNGEIKGGAKYTRARKKNGIWKYYLKISNLTKSEAYSMESLTKWAAKKNYKDKKIDKGKTPLERKVNLLLSFKDKFPHCEINFI